LRPRVVAPLAALILASAVWALDEPKDKDKSDKPDKPPSAAEKLKDLQKEVQKARSEILGKRSKAKTEEEKDELLQQYFAAPNAFAGKFVDLAKAEPKDPVALQALLFVVTQAAGSPQAMTAADLIVTDHIADTKILYGQLPMLARSPSPVPEKVLRGLMSNAEGDDHGKVSFALAQLLKEQVGVVRELKDASPDDVKQMTSRLGEAGVKTLQAADPDKIEAEAATLFEAVIEKHADVKFGNRTLGSQAKPDLHELRHLAVGKPAPVIEAEDIDGTKFKLSDYRGKVVLLDFWGHW
jgi:hypothetical protein